MSKKHTKQKSNPVKYRLIVIKESDYGSWADKISPNGGWEDPFDEDLDRIYCEWLNKISKTIPINEEKKLIDLKKNIEVRVLDVNVQRGEYNKKLKVYKWEDYDHRSPRGDLMPCMR